MILTCPKCATRFFADDHAIGPAGRSVQCAACREVWFSEGAEAAPPTDPDMPATIADESPPSPVSPLFVERAAPPRQAGVKRAGRPWAIGLLILALVIVAGMVVFKREIEHVVPGASALYQSAGLRRPDHAGG